MIRYSLLILIVCITACQTASLSNSNLAALDTTPATLALGNPVDLTLLQPLNTVLSESESFVNQRVTIKGKIDKACKKKGCWADVVSDNDKLRIKVADDVIVIPLYTIGQDVYATGVLKRYEMSIEKSIAHQKHMAKDAGEAFDPTSVKKPMTFYQLETDAIKIL